jgi:hypothetical protein
MKKASPDFRVILGVSRYGGIGFQPVCILDGYDKLEVFPTCSRQRFLSLFSGQRKLKQFANLD